MATTPQRLADHLSELRKRLLVVFLVLIVGVVIGYVFRGQIIAWGAKPLGLPLYYNSPSGGLEFVFQVCFGLGVILALPVAIYNIIRFVEPALSKKRLGRPKTIMLMLASTFLAVSGIIFAYYIILPMSFKFFGQYSSSGVTPLISTKEYFSFTTACLAFFALIFQVPLVLLIFNSIRRFPPGSLRKYRPHTYVGSFVIALILPFTYDPITQFVVAIPIIFFFELSVFLIWISNIGAGKSHPRSESSKDQSHGTKKDSSQVDTLRPLG